MTTRGIHAPFLYPLPPPVPSSLPCAPQVAAAANGTVAPRLVRRGTGTGTGTEDYVAADGPVYGFCFQPSTQLLASLALAVLAPIVQRNGPAQVGWVG